MTSTLPKIFYERTTRHGLTTTRYGSRQFKVCVCTMRTPTMATNWIVEIGRLNLSGGPAGGVEAGLDDVPGRYRIHHHRNGTAFAALLYSPPKGNQR